MSVLRDRLGRAVRRAIERTSQLVEPLLARKICPTCHARQLEPDPDLAPRSDEGHPKNSAPRGSLAYVAGYRCRSCGGQWRSLDAGPLIPLTAWDAGVRDDGTGATPIARSVIRVAKRALDRATRLVEPLLARKVCPDCHARMLEPDPEHAIEQRGSSHVAAYRCRQCCGQWRSLDGGTLISRADWDDGVRGSEVPTATARTRTR